MSSSDLLIGDVFANAAAAVPDRPAAWLDGGSLTFSALDRAANRTARALVALGLTAGDRLVTLAGTSLELLIVFAASSKLGTVFAPLNPALAPSEARPVLEAVSPSLVVTDRERRAAGSEVALTLDTPVVTIEELVEAAGALSEAAFDQPTLRESDAHVVFFTSGSSGRPKGAVISHRTSYLRSHPGALLEFRGAMVCPYPLFHMGAWTIALQQWQARDAVVLVPSAHAASICRAVTTHRATRLNCIPALWRRILDHLASADGGASSLGSLRFADTGTSATPKELLRSIERAAPSAEVRVFYGSTEAGSVASLASSDFETKEGRCGVPGPGTSVRVDGDGVLWVRGPLLFDGYFGDREATAAVFDGDWFCTGDLAECDEDGYLTIVGRAGEVLRTGGESVVPAEVEAVLGSHPKVADVAVVGVSDQDWGELVCAVVVVAAGATAPTLEEFAAHCEGRLARYKQPRRLELVDEIPRTPSTGQIQRRLLVERLD